MLLLKAYWMVFPRTCHYSCNEYHIKYYFKYNLRFESKDNGTCLGCIKGFDCGKATKVLLASEKFNLMFSVSPTIELVLLSSFHI